MSRRAPIAGAAIVLLAACAPLREETAQPVVEPAIEAPAVVEVDDYVFAPGWDLAWAISRLQDELTMFREMFAFEDEYSGSCAFYFEFPADRMSPSPFTPTRDRRTTVERLGRDVEATSRRITDPGTRTAFERDIVEPFRLLRERYGDPAGR